MYDSTAFAAPQVPSAFGVQSTPAEVLVDAVVVETDDEFVVVVECAIVVLACFVVVVDGATVVLAAFVVVVITSLVGP